MTISVSLQQLKEQQRLLIRKNQSEVLLFYFNEKVHAYSGICPHLGGPLEHGAQQRQFLQCPWHHYQFNIETGQCVTPAGKPWRLFEGEEKCSKEPFPLRLKRIPFTVSGDQIQLQI